MKLDIITLSVIQKALENIAEEMGIVLRRASFSPNCKERLDFSCAIFNRNADLLAQAEHIPVHLGAMFSSMETILQEFPTEELNPEDIIILNSPYQGGTHLPDVTFLMPVFIGDELSFFVNNRAHHADIGGSTPGSMPGISSELFEEGLIIPPVRLYDRGREVKDVMKLILSNVRVQKERLGDFRAQRASLIRGKDRLVELSKKYGYDYLIKACNELMNLSEEAFQEQLNKLIIPPEGVSFHDFLDSDGITDELVKICVNLSITGKKLLVSFKGTDSQQTGNVNAPRSVVYSCVYYVFRSLTDPTIMTNAGLFRNIEIEIPKGSLLDPCPPAAVSSGNVETSQRLVDVLLGALSRVLPEIPAASQGTMNNVSIGGFDSGGNPFTYYETIGGGTGGSMNYRGVSGIHSHMTNTLNTPIEALELVYPLRITRYSFRDDSSGSGLNQGGQGLIREIECLVDAVVSLQTERRKLAPYGLNGGEDGMKGVNIRRKIDGKEIILPGRAIVNFKAGETLIIKTPGGGGWGKLNDIREAT
ncbi:MAG: hydantoinase B/oxoprolinase family protein [Candidatus Heimdallarchaeota archaeon]|nr:MAG: hydantoinase B/oxoprolinase family protein [Candidatus Heimdallarchaeota archaeon]